MSVRWPVIAAILYAFIGATPGVATQVLIPSNGVVRFPLVDGVEGAVKLRLTSPAPANTMLTVNATTTVAGRPSLRGGHGKVLAVFFLTTNKAISVAFSPEWRIGMPSPIDAKKPYYIYAYEIAPNGNASEVESYLQEPRGRTLVTVGSSASTCPVPPKNGIECYSRTLKPGYTYAFELVQNPPLPPPPWTPPPHQVEQ